MSFLLLQYSTAGWFSFQIFDVQNILQCFVCIHFLFGIKLDIFFRNFFICFSRKFSNLYCLYSLSSTCSINFIESHGCIAVVTFHHNSSDAAPIPTRFRLALLTITADRASKVRQNGLCFLTLYRSSFDDNNGVLSVNPNHIYLQSQTYNTP